MTRINIATRREFLTRGMGIVGVGCGLPNLLVRSALAGPKDASDDRIVVALLLTGGPDGLSLVPPYADDEYYVHRKVLRVPTKEVLKLNDEVGLHPQLPRIKKFYDRGDLAVVLGTGYPGFTLSHFVGREIWEAAKKGVRLGQQGSTGWLGRFVDHACENPDPTLNVAVGSGRLPLLITGKEHPGIGFSSPDSFRFLGDRTTEGQALYRNLNKMNKKSKMKEASTQADLQFITKTATNANAASERLGELSSHYKTPVRYPDTQFGQSMKTIAGFINGGLDARVYYAAQGIATFGGYDTHADQPRRLATLLNELDETMDAFYKDLARSKNADRVLAYTYSEFGRRVKENHSGGTDHGVAQPMFLFGPGVKAGVHGQMPSLTDLDKRGNLKTAIDFRRVYTAILEKWLKVPGKTILGKKYAPIDCIG